MDGARFFLCPQQNPKTLTHNICYIDPVVEAVAGVWHTTGFALAAVVLLSTPLLAIGALFKSWSSLTRRSKACSLAVLLPGTVLAGSSPARIKPWPAPS